MIAVEGCYWGSPYEVRVYDFSNPMSPPWPILHLDQANDRFCGWIDVESCKIGRCYDVVNLPGHPCHGIREDKLTEDQYEEIERLANEQGKDEEDFYEEKTDSIFWRQTCTS